MLAHSLRGQTLRRWLLPALIGVAILALGLATPGAMRELGARAGYGLCHQLASRSFRFAGVQFPFCARCTGTYTGLLLTLAAVAGVGRGRWTGLPTRRVGAAIAVIVALMAVDGFNSLADLASAGAVRLYAPSNWLRFATGHMYGAALALVIAPVLANVLWLLDNATPVLATRRGALGLPAMALLAAGIVAALGAPLAGPLALASTVGALVALGMVNTAGLLIATGLAHRAHRWREVALPLAAGLALGVLEIGALSAIRSALPAFGGSP